MSKRKLDAKAFAQQKRKRRQWITFVRMCRYGINNFSRNMWLTVAATAVMTITLLVVFITLMSRNILLDSVADIRNKVDMSIYVKTDTSNTDIQTIQKALEGLSTVKEVTFTSPEEGRTDFAQTHKADANTLGAINEATNEFPGVFHIKVADINNTTELRHFTETNQTYKKDADSHAPSFAGDRKDAIENIGRWISLGQNIGLIASIVFIAISSLIIFNTIRMAIFNRRDEIQMMKLIGADRNFIRGPFVVEAIVYGFIAAIIATAFGMTILYASKDALLNAQVAIGGTVEFVTTYIGFVLLGMIVLGAIIGVVSSLLATRRYLRI